MEKMIMIFKCAGVDTEEELNVRAKTEDTVFGCSRRLKI